MTPPPLEGAGSEPVFRTTFGLPFHNAGIFRVEALNSVFTSVPAPNVALLLATITFNVTAGAPGSFDLFTMLTGFEGIEHLAGGGLGTASITKTPEPGTLSLLVMGLTGLYVVGRRRGR